MTEFNERSRSGNPFLRTLRDPQVNNRTLRRRRNPRDRTWNRDNYAWKYSGGVAIHLQLYRHKRQNTSRSTDLRVRTRTYIPTLHRRRDTYTSSLLGPLFSRFVCSAAQCRRSRCPALLKPHTWQWHRAWSPLRVRASRRHAGTRARARASKWCRWGARRLGDPGPGPHGQRQVVRACALTATRAGTSPSRGLFTRSARAGPWPLLAVSSGYWPTRQLAEYSQ